MTRLTSSTLVYLYCFSVAVAVELEFGEQADVVVVRLVGPGRVVDDGDCCHECGGF